MSILKPILSAILLSLFLYLDYYIDFKNQVLNTIFAISGLYIFLTLNKKQSAIFGFITSFLWLYWISFSFIYYDLTYLIPFIILGITLFYALVFYFIAYFDNPFSKAFILFLFSFIEPFGFNWFKFELLFVETPLASTKLAFLFILLALALLIQFRTCCKKKGILRKFAVLCVSTTLLYFAKDTTIEPLKPNINIYLQDQKLAQNQKWKKENLNEIIKNNIIDINKAIKHKYEVIILNESAFPLILNENDYLLNLLKQMSHNITIVAGGLRQINKNYYNSAYYFINGKLTIVNKVILVPFGEKIPLPDFIAKYLNKIFFGEVEDYTSANEPTDIIIKNIKFRNAICFEATKDKLFINAPKQMIAMSNNAWFHGSIQSTLQKYLMKYYSKKYGTYIYHSFNSGS